ncbi:3-oxoacyl-ACP reductase [Amycolatopsis sp. WAC 04197]|uniref:SDR family NAD(P)-dependent oxidoreductase n=1 Tax=Amycolatopsis sp. WAC 04197 TaxID=2203199 RepID=UPI000F7A6E2D|nr:SDR family oxidoreductase [Amycolatopsis sp. WAC 04197]RSN39085.1 3-oxoacyl-ACP reductase [Amycolatopsis sp. WAC 04197]
MTSTVKGKTALVTGAGRGIGRAITRELLNAGAFVLAGSRNATRDLADLRSAQNELHTVDVDLSRPDGASELVDAALSRFGTIDIVMNNVGGPPGGTPRFGGFLDVSDEEWIAGLELNLMSLIRVVRAALPSMLTGGGGSIVNISSVNALRPDPQLVDYSAAKAAVRNLAKALSIEFAGRGVRVNTLSPGPVRTSVWTREGGIGDQIGAQLGIGREEAMTAVADGMGGISLGRFGTPEEIARVAVFLASPEASFMTGSDVVLDGGLIKTL